MRQILLAILLTVNALPALGQVGNCQQLPDPNPNPSPGGQVGCSIALLGDSLVLGAHRDGAGSVTPCQRTQRDWLCGSKLVPSEGKPGDQFGRSVGLLGDWLAVGAPFKDSGVVYLFQKNGGGVWVERQKLAASDAARGDEFGLVLSMSGGTLMVGAPNHVGNAGSLSGAVYVFRLTGDSWTQRQKLTASDARPFDNFGFSISLDGDTAVVGAPFHDRGGTAGNSGAAYVFVRNGDAWSEQARLTAGDGSADDQFGSAVAVSGNALAVGARGDNENRGSAYVYERRDPGWGEVAHFFGEARGDRFGVAASMSGVRLLVGALLHDGSGADSGAAYLYKRGTGPDGTFRWERTGDPLRGDAAGDRFGQAVSIHGEDLLVGAYLADVGGAQDAGSARVCQVQDGHDDPLKPEIAVTKTDHLDQVAPGETVTYTITVSNVGKGAAPEVLVTDRFSSKLTGVSWCAPQIGQSCANPIKGNINRTISLAPGQSVVFTATGTVKINASGILTNQACAQILPDGKKECKDDVPPDQIVPTPRIVDLKLDKSGPVQVRPGDRIVYTLTVTNLGPDIATGVQLEDTIPEGLHLVKAPGCSTADGKITCNLPDLTPQQPRSVRLTFDVLQTCLASIVNRARVFANEEDRDSENDTREVITSLSRTAPLVVEKTGPDTVEPGDSILYAVKVTNLGPDLACGVALNDPVPAGLASPVVPDGCEFIGGNVRCLIGELPPGSRTFPVSFTVPQEVECDSTITNTATVTVIGTGATTATAAATVTCPPPDVFDLSISKTDGLETAESGQTLLYVLTVRNAGTTSVAATVSDEFPQELTSVRWCRDVGSPCAPDREGNLMDTVLLAPGDEATYRAQGTVAAIFTGTLTNTATVAGPSGFDDTNPDDNSATDTTVITLPSGVTVLCKDISGKNLEGETMTFTFVLMNGGPNVQMDNPGDEFTDTLPAGLTLVSASASGGVASTSGNTATWNGSIPVGGMVTITVTATIDLGTAGTTICNPASIAFDADGNGTNESSGLSDACCFPVLPASAIPALSVPGLLALAVLLAVLALLRLRQPAL